MYARTGDKGVPLVWEHSSGSGRVVVDNIGIYDKVLRGVYAASYSLLCDATAYPVINGAVFYLDDFPSPGAGRRWHLYPPGLQHEHCGFLRQSLVAGPDEAGPEILHPLYRRHDRKLRG